MHQIMPPVWYFPVERRAGIGYNVLERKAPEGAGKEYGGRE